jgi:hypothetical protein
MRSSIVAACLAIAATAGEPQADVPEGFVATPTAEHSAFFESSIRPLLITRCLGCHGAEVDDPGGGLLLDSRRGLIVGGDTGPAVIAGKPAESLLIRAVRRDDSRLRMPPDEALPPEEIHMLERWVEMGLPDPRSDDTVAAHRDRTAIDWEAARDFWSLRPIEAVEPPPVRQADWPVHPIDRFVLARLEARGLEPAADASREAWIRRATYDLIGLPPTPEEIDAFLHDESPGAHDRVVERLLGSRQYGERWGRHWLDVVRYADTAGDNSDFPIPQMVRYRDWVIEAFNRDLPYDEFVRQQLAGDLLPATSTAEHHRQLVATGYIANARRFGSRVDDYPQHLTIEDTIDNVGRTFLAATLGCARCHDHKFDPFTMGDYYGLYGIFQSTRYPWPGIELDQRQRDLVPLVDEATVQAAREAHEARRVELERTLDEAQRQRKEAAADSAVLRELDDQVQTARKAVDRHRKTPLPVPFAYAVVDATRIEDSHIQVKGDPAKPGDRVPRRFPRVLGGQELAPDDRTSGRLQLAEWILDEGNPLAMRVLINRVWLYHFGQGLVATPNDFGRQGQPPSHPELLDWLAREFVAGGYSIKALHRAIMLSRTYRQSTTGAPAARDLDPTNVLLGSFPRRRLDAEAIRDTILWHGGTLDLFPGPAHPFPPPTAWNFTQHKPFKAVYDTPHRSVYLMTQRIQRHPLLAIFDGADPAASTPQRLTSTTPVQALYFLNDPVVHEQAAAFAGRMLAAEDHDAARIRFAYRHLFGRPPDAEEIAEAAEYVAAAQAVDAEPDAWAAWVRVMFRLNEFVYVD